MHDDTSIIENERLRLIIMVKWIEAHEAFQVIWDSNLFIYLKMGTVYWIIFFKIKKSINFSILVGFWKCGHP